MATDLNLYRLTSPRIFLVRMLAFLILAGFVALVLNRQIANAFMANPGLNGLIFAILAIGVALALLQVGRLMREVRWANALGTSNMVKPPVLLAPVATILGEDFAGRSISTVTLRALLDSIGQRLDEQREIGRYLVGLLVFLGLLGTFWGLLETVGSIGDVIKSMQTGGDSAVMFDDLKNGLAAPIAGMSISFTSSLFGLAGSLILGFLDLQAGQAQNRFFHRTRGSPRDADGRRRRARPRRRVPGGRAAFRAPPPPTRAKRSRASRKASRASSSTCATSSSSCANGWRRKPISSAK